MQESEFSSEDVSHVKPRCSAKVIAPRAGFVVFFLHKHLSQKVCYRLGCNVRRRKSVGNYMEKYSKQVASLESAEVKK